MRCLVVLLPKFQGALVFPVGSVVALANARPKKLMSTTRMKREMKKKTNYDNEKNIK